MFNARIFNCKISNTILFRWYLNFNCGCSCNRYCDTDPDKNPITTITSSLKDVETTELAKSASALNDVAIALERISKVGNLSMVGRNFEKFAKSLLGTTPLLHLLYHGGEYGAGWFDGLKEVKLDQKYALKTLMEDGTLSKMKEGTESMFGVLRSMNMGMNPNLYVAPVDTSGNLSGRYGRFRGPAYDTMGGNVNVVNNRGGDTTTINKTISDVFVGNPAIQERMLGSQ